MSNKYVSIKNLNIFYFCVKLFGSPFFVFFALYGINVIMFFSSLTELDIHSLDFSIRHLASMVDPYRSREI